MAYNDNFFILRNIGTINTLMVQRKSSSKTRALFLHFHQSKQFLASHNLLQLPVTACALPKLLQLAEH
jgi:hypothetical protein